MNSEVGVGNPSYPMVGGYKPPLQIVGVGNPSYPMVGVINRLYKSSGLETPPTQWSGLESSPTTSVFA